MSNAARTVERHSITAEVVPGPTNPDWSAPHTSWLVTLRFEGRTMTVPFHMGLAHTHEPEAPEVLECLASDASGADNADGFADWASEYGYDTDSRKAEALYRQICEQVTELRTFLGAEVYTELLYGEAE